MTKGEWEGRRNNFGQISLGNQLLWDRKGGAMHIQ